jgi:hypothetical protein
MQPLIPVTFAMTFAVTFAPKSQKLINQIAQKPYACAFGQMQIQKHLHHAFSEFWDKQLPL